MDEKKQNLKELRKEKLRNEIKLIQQNLSSAIQKEELNKRKEYWNDRNEHWNKKNYNAKFTIAILSSIIVGASILLAINRYKD